jgi:hypothetical protein
MFLREDFSRNLSVFEVGISRSFVNLQERLYAAISCPHVLHRGIKPLLQLHLASIAFLGARASRPHDCEERPRSQEHDHRAVDAIAISR